MSDAALTAFGLTLQLLRQQQELSLNALGKLAGVDPAYLWRLERGEKQDPSLSIVRRIAIGLGIAPQAFLSRLLQVEAALEAERPVELAPVPAAEAVDPDAALFDELLAEREQKDRIRRSLSAQWTNVLASPDAPAGKVLRVPVLGRIAAGRPLQVDAEDVEGYLAVTGAGLPRDSRLFALEVDGDSLQGDNIHPGDYVLCAPGLVPDLVSGQVGVARVYGTELTLKHVFRTSQSVILRASNPKYPDLEVPADEVDILAVVVRAIPQRLAQWESEYTA